MVSTYNVISAKNLANLKGVGKGAFRATIEGGDLPATTTVFNGTCRVVTRDGIAIGGVYKTDIRTSLGFQAYSFRDGSNGAAVRAYGATEEEAVASFKLRFEGYIARAKSQPAS